MKPVHSQAKLAGLKRQRHRIALHRLSVHSRLRHQQLQRQKGSTLVVVIALMGLLALLGVSFVLWTSQEQVNSEFAAAAAANDTHPGLDPNEVLNFAMEQVIIGPKPEFTNSALYRGRHSLLPAMMGKDLHPYSGQPVNVIRTLSGAVGVDQDYDGVIDGASLQNFMDIADSYAANSGEDTNNNGILDPGEDTNNNGILDRGAQFSSLGYPYPDVDHTYFGINNVFLGYNGFGLDASDFPVRVIIPSFHRPQFLRGTAGPYPDWQTNLSLGQQIMRPHPAHVDVDPNGIMRGPVGAATTPILAMRSRYVWPLNRSGLTNYPPGITGPFPFGISEDVNEDGILGGPVDLNGDGVISPAEAAGEDVNGNGSLDTSSKEGVWTLGSWQNDTYYRDGQWVIGSVAGGTAYFRCTRAGRSAGSSPLWNNAANDYDSLTDGTVTWQRRPSFVPEYEWDADPDGDGTKEAIWLDLGFPVQTRGDGKKYIPLFAITIYDADGLINLNTSGNLNGTALFGDRAFGFGVGQDGQPGDAGVDDDGDGQVDNLSELGDVGADGQRGTADDSDDTISISRSNFGMFPSEINPTWALTARPIEDLPSDQTAARVFYNHQRFFRQFNRAPSNWTWQEVANQEFWFSLMGRPEYDVVNGRVINEFSGRWGELQRMNSQVFSSGLPNASLFPKSGLAFDSNLQSGYEFLSDDNGNRFVGEYINEDSDGDGIIDPGEDANGNGILDQRLAFAHPLDFNGGGRAIHYSEDINGNGTLDPGEDRNGNGSIDRFWSPLFFFPTGSHLRYRQFDGYQTVGTVPLRWGPDGAPGRVNVDDDLDGSTDFLNDGSPDLDEIGAAGSDDGQMMPNATQGALIDEPGETVVDSRYRTGGDDPFSPSENYFLHASDADVEKSATTARLAALLPYNFSLNVRAQDIRKRFTTESWDVRTFGTSWFGYGPDDSRRKWEFTAAGEDLNNNNVLDMGEDADGDSQLDEHENQFGRTLYQFPPTFSGATAATQPFRPVLRDLLRVIPEINNSSLLPDGEFIYPAVQRALSMNDILVYSEDLNGNNLLDEDYNRNGQLDPGEDVNGNGQLDNEDINGNYKLDVGFRALIEHPVNTGITILPSSLPEMRASRGFGTSNSETANQEVWARRDRQKMARDIYVLLYTFGGGDDSVNYTTVSASDPKAYTLAQKREMAQFAVNFVDAMDSDNVITKFEYDIDLSDGWNLDDNAYAPSESSQRRVVYGVEEQRLTISETLAFVQLSDPNDDIRSTLFEEHDGTDPKDHAFLFVELRNPSNKPVDLSRQPSTSEATGVWRLRLVPISTTDEDTNDDGIFTEPSNPPGANDDVDADKDGQFDIAGIPDCDESGGIGAQHGSEASRLTFLRNAGVIAGGETFTIGGGDNFGGSNRSSDFYYDDTDDSTENFNLIIPNTGNVTITATDTPDPYTDLDLNHQRDQTNKFEAKNSGAGLSFFDFATLTAPTANDGLNVTGNNAASSTANRFYIVLERRANLDLPSLSEVLNPWVEVDRSVVSVRDLQLVKNDESDDALMRSRLANLKSMERIEPFDPERSLTRLEFDDAPPSTPDQGLLPRTNDQMHFNTIGLTTSTGATARNHNLRPYGSSPSLPPTPYRYQLWQPHFDRAFYSTIELLDLPLYGPDRVTSAMVEIDVNSKRRYSGHNTAGVRKFLKPDAGTGSDLDDNRWYRLLSFFEVPPLAHQNASIPANRRYRIPGKLNLNTIRHPDVLAALLDNDRVFTLNLDDPSSHLDDASEATRDWWVQFVQSRDQLDPVTGFYLPGMPNSRPFRSLNFAAGSDTSVDLNGNGTIESSEQRNEPIEHTVLRSLPLDVATPLTLPPKRRLFELGTAGQHGANDIDHKTRHHLLAKIANNTTTRSNVFFVFIQVEFFEAAVTEDVNGNGILDDYGNGVREDLNNNGVLDDKQLPDGSVPVRIGAKMKDTPKYRGFFVVDRSRALEQLNSTHFMNEDTFSFSAINEDLLPNGVLDAGEDLNANGVLNTPFDFNQLIIHRQIIE